MHKKVLLTATAIVAALVLSACSEAPKKTGTVETEDKKEPGKAAGRLGASPTPRWKAETFQRESTSAPSCLGVVPQKRASHSPAASLWWIPMMPTKPRLERRRAG